MTRQHDPDGRRLPIKLDTTSNGEFAPIPLEPVHHHARRLASDRATENAKRRGVSRRSFLVSACGAASTLLAMNAAYAAAGRSGGFYDLADAAAVDPDIAAAALDSREFIFDVQGHFVKPDGAWLKQVPPDAKPLSFFEKSGCALAEKPGKRSYLQCLSSDEFIKDVFMDSDTDMMVLSSCPRAATPNR